MRIGKVIELTMDIAPSAATIGHQRKLAMVQCNPRDNTRSWTLWTQDADFKSVSGVNIRPKVDPKIADCRRIDLNDLLLAADNLIGTSYGQSMPTFSKALALCLRDDRDPLLWCRGCVAYLQTYGREQIVHRAERQQHQIVALPGAAGRDL